MTVKHPSSPSSDHSSSITDGIHRFWIPLHLVYLALILLYVLVKTKNSIHPIYSGMEQTSLFDKTGFGMMLLGFLSVTTAVLFSGSGRRRVYWIAGFSYFLIALGYTRTVDPGLEWQRSDVARGNYGAAEEFAKHGIMRGIRDWNERANPYAGFSSDGFSDATRSIIDSRGLRWLAFDKWKSNRIQEGYDIENNRPVMHPPFTTVVIALWLKMAPFGHASAQLLMVMLQWLSILLALLLTGRSIAQDQWRAFLMLALMTSPVMIRFHNPSAEPLLMILFLAAVLLIRDPRVSNPVRTYLSGVLIGLAFYTKFVIIFYIIFQILFLLFGNRPNGLKIAAFYLSGVLTVFFLFFAAGYYFWLTMLTGFVCSGAYAREAAVTGVQAVSKIFYFGPSVLLLTVFLSLGWKRNDQKTILVPVLLSLAVSAVYLFEQGALNRYLVFYLPVLWAFLSACGRPMHPKRGDILIVPVVHLIFLAMNVYY